MKSTRYRFSTSLAVFVLMSVVAGGQTLQLEKTVTASGGGTSTGGSLIMEITAGQHAAGGILTGASGTVYIGFWTPELAPTAAGVTISGRATTSAGQGLANIMVTLVNANGDIWIARTGPFGYYRFDQVPVGNSYLLTASSKQWVFTNLPRVISVNDDISALDLIALEP